MNATIGTDQVWPVQTAGPGSGLCSGHAVAPLRLQCGLSCEWCDKLSHGVAHHGAAQRRIGPDSSWLKPALGGAHGVAPRMVKGTLNPAPSCGGIGGATCVQAGSRSEATLLIFPPERSSRSASVLSHCDCSSSPRTLP